MTDPCKSRDRSTLPFPQLTTIPDDLGEYIARYVRLVMEMGLEDCVKKIVEDGEIFGPGGLDHLSCRLLKQYWDRKGGGGGFVRTEVDRGIEESIPGQDPTPIRYGTHLFFAGGVSLMVSKLQWVVFPYSVAKKKLWLSLSLPGVK